MKLTRSDLRQLIREVIQKEGIGDWLDRMRAADKESGAEYREKRAASEQEKEEKEASGTRIGGSKRKKFAGSELGKGAEKELREEEEEMSEAKRARPAEFKSGDKVTHEEYGTGTVTHPGASTDATGGREVSVKWDDPDIGSRRAIEANLKKK